MSGSFSNPLDCLRRQMGIAIQRLVHMTGLSEALIRKTLSDEPHESVQAFIRIAEAIEAKPVRLQKAPPVRVWLDMAHVDGLYRDVDYRRYHKLPELPANRGELRGIIQKMRRGNKSYNEIIEFLEQGQICTAEGFPNWRPATIKQHIELGKVVLFNDSKPLSPQQDTVDQWRRFVLNDLVATACPEDPMFAIRYGVSPQYEGGKVWLETSKPLPTGPRGWFMRGLAAATFFEGRWGEAETESSLPCEPSRAGATETA